MTDDETRVAEIRQRAEAATEGPWERRLYDGVRDSKSRLVKVVEDSEFDFERVTSLADYITRENAEFIAHAREDIPWLLEQLRTAEAERDAVKGPFACCKCCAEGVDPELHAEQGRDFHDEPCTSCERETELGKAKNALAAAEVRAAEAEAVIAEARAVHKPIDAAMYSGRDQRIVKVCTGCGTERRQLGKVALPYRARPIGRPIGSQGMKEQLIYFANSERCPWWLEGFVRRVTAARIPRQRRGEFDDDYIDRMKRTHPHLAAEDLGFVETAFDHRAAALAHFKAQGMNDAEASEAVEGMPTRTETEQ